MNRNLSSEQQKRRFLDRVYDQGAGALQDVDDAAGLGAVGEAERKILAEIDSQDEAQEVQNIIQHKGTTGRKIA